MNTRWTVRSLFVPTLLAVAVGLSAAVIVHQQVSAAPGKVAVAGQGEPISDLADAQR